MSGTKDYYVYPAVFDYADDGITIDFPDLPGCMPCAFSTEEAVKMPAKLWGSTCTTWKMTAMKFLSLLTYSASLMTQIRP